MAKVHLLTVLLLLLLNTTRLTMLLHLVRTLASLNFVDTTRAKPFGLVIYPEVDVDKTLTNIWPRRFPFVLTPLLLFALKGKAVPLKIQVRDPALVAYYCDGVDVNAYIVFAFRRYVNVCGAGLIWKADLSKIGVQATKTNGPWFRYTNEYPWRSCITDAGSISDARASIVWSKLSTLGTRRR